MIDSAGRILLITGGIGGAKLSVGFSKIYESDLLSFVVNTGDDFDYMGLRICPDIDTLLYSLSDQADQKRGWGLSDETWSCLDSLKRLGCETWFNLGDKDLATHIYRNYLMAKGASLSDITLDIAKQFSINSLIMPMSNDPLHTVLHTDEGSLDFQDYFVRRSCIPVLRSVSFTNFESARPPPVLLDYFAKTPPEVIILCPSNPFLSIDPILNVPGVTQLILDSRAPVLAVSPIVNGESLKGPTAKILTELGMPVSAAQVAKYYQENYPGLISTFVIDNSDSRLSNTIQDLGLNVFVTHTIMKSEREKIELAESLLGFCG
tara:strand:+ start:41 stop:1000 length:960 start_codon:yes stop_codon:yes gene_type:complete